MANIQSLIIRALTPLPLIMPRPIRRIILESKLAHLGDRWYRRVLAGDASQIVDLQAPLDGYRMRINLLMNKSFIYGTFEPAVCDWILHHVKPGWTCLDIGANVGYVSLLLARQVGSQGRVYAFEPLPTNFAALRENVAMNQQQGTIHCECVALADRAEMHEFRFRSEAFTGGGSLVAAVPKGANAEITKVQVQTLPGDQILAIRDAIAVDFIKIDVEGAEGLVLEGLRGTIQKFRPIILFEAHTGEGNTVAQARKILAEYGYSLTPIDDSHVLAVHRLKQNDSHVSS